MNEIRTRIHVSADHRITGIAPADVPPGEHEVAITVGASAARQRAGKPFDVTDLPTIDLGPWPASAGLRREDMYSDDGR